MNQKTLLIAFSAAALVLVTIGVSLFMEDTQVGPVSNTVDQEVVETAINEDAELVSLDIPSGWKRDDRLENFGMSSENFELRSEEDSGLFECGIAQKGGHIMVSTTSVLPNESSDTDPLTYATSLLPKESLVGKNYSYEIITLNDYPYALISQFNEGCKTGKISANARIDKKLISIYYEYADIDPKNAKTFFSSVLATIKFNDRMN